MAGTAIVLPTGAAGVTVTFAAVRCRAGIVCVRVIGAEAAIATSIGVAFAFASAANRVD